MIVYQSPGVYIQEVPAGPQPIVAASTSVLAVVGTTQRGPFGEPTRVTGWAEFRAAFGDLVEGLHTAEAMYGFFENGGPAAWVVRVDPSVAAQWAALQDNATTEVFRVLAASPGAWANGLGVAVSPDLTAGGGRLYSSPIVAPTGLGTGAREVTVESTAGLTVGDTVAIVTTGTNGAATVTAVNAEAKTVGLNVTTAGSFTAGATWLAATVGNGATAARLASGGGIRRGDVVLFVPASRAVQSAFVDAAIAAQPGLALTLAPGPGAAVAALEFGPRVERFSGFVNAAPGGTDLPFAGVAFVQTPAPATGDVLAGFTATSSNGGVGEWTTAASQWGFAGPVPAGRVDVEAIVTLTRFAATVALANPTLEALTTDYGFVPEGTTLRLLGGTPLNLTRTATGWTGGDPTTGTYTGVEFRPSNDSTQGVLVRSAFEPRVGEFVRFNTAANTSQIASVERKAEGLYVVKTATAVNASAINGPYQVFAFQPTQVVPQRFAISVTEGGAEVESYRGLALHPDHPSYYFRDSVLNDVSSRIRVTERAAGPISLASFPALATQRATGANLPASAADVKRGFTALEKVTEPALVICPDAVALDETEQADVVGAMLTHCEEFRRFAVVDAPQGMTDTELADWRLRNVNSGQGAVYAPWLRILNLDATSAKRVVDVPPSGFVAGVYARTDRERGVHKAPANERVRGIVGLATEYTQRRQDLLNPSGVNLIRTFPGRGIRIWGARNATDDVQWRYVNVRRLFNFIETSVERSTQWVVFEPNIASTWLRIRVSVENFLDQLWRSGALAGTSAEQAYRVRVGLGETMTETDIDLGLVVTEVAVAPAKPAEFVVFRFSHKRITE